MNLKGNSQYCDECDIILLRVSSSTKSFLKCDNKQCTLYNIKYEAHYDNRTNVWIENKSIYKMDAYLK